MLSKDTKFDLPDELVEALPTDPFEQLDVARKITSIALSTRVSSLESELSVLQEQLDDRDSIIAGLEEQLQSLDASLGDMSDKLAAAQQEKENLMRENEQLSSTVRKLNRDVAKLETFRKTLMRSLQDEDDNPASAQRADAARAQSVTDEDGTLTPTRTASMRSQFSDAGDSNAKDSEAEVRPRVSQGLLLASQTSTPRLTPPGSPPNLSASVSPSRTPKPLSPRRHSISFATSRGFFDDKYSSVPSSQYSSMSGLDSGSQSGRTRVDGKEFFRIVRTRLSYEQFGAFLANVKELNSHKQTKEETLRKADEIFGPENKDLYAIFEGLIMRNVQ